MEKTAEQAADFRWRRSGLLCKALTSGRIPADFRDAE
jgi:hypothetical protein